MSIQDNVFLNHAAVVCAGGNSLAQLKRCLLDRQADVMTWTEEFGTTALPVGKCQGELTAIPLEGPQWQSRNNQIALAVYEQICEQVAEAVQQYGANRVGVVIGTSTSGIGDAEPAIKHYVETGALPKEYHYSVQEMANTAEFVAELAGVTGPVYAISTACSSGAKALISAKRLISSGLCDVVIAGGVDSLCKLTLQGFSALEAVSDEVCLPFSVNRRGINIGEGGALFVVSKQREGVRLAGMGESSDAHHISAPEPEGKGAEQAMQQALQDAGLNPSEIDYINLHGTATSLNDQMESLAVSRVFPATIMCSSTKPFTGHTLGAAGAIEAAICWLALTEAGFVPPHCWDGQADPALPALNFVAAQARNTTINRAISNSFAFGGNNVALVMESVR
ncbi:beta-ketoacyl-[acyl-carrier-protein] synthase family protein [uncultured Methylophaga sp.]|uniref:beta-ketoacyl-[acyl-carrier-protein] synthase family protein n=1 Tax=uncultured Methylophaga sp. TaxID=285271 RepID=UPI0026051033|nr:beta-ketoacyl-[acyl-carrier-protein] synthase family protein [uncultured Methylophaga sp.]